MRDEGDKTVARQGRLDRIDRRLGRIWSRVGGTVIIAIGVGALVSLSGSEGYSIATHWPGLLIAGAFVALGIVIFRSRAPLSETLDDGPPRKPRR